jgi:DNA ligase-1
VILPEEFKPLLAASVEDIEQLRFPLLASPKLDGVRCIGARGEAISRNMKPIPNKHVQDVFKTLAQHHPFDGELVVGSPKDPLCFQNTQSGVMRAEGRPDFKFWIFDIVSGEPFYMRLERVRKYIKGLGMPAGIFQYVAHKEVRTAEQLLNYEATMLLQGFEGIMLRDAKGDYKYGRSTLNEHILLKLKRFADAEAVVVGYEELMVNRNPQTRDELGRSKRSSHKANKLPAGILGALLVKDVETEIVFQIGSGFTETQRHKLWQERDSLSGRVLTYKYQPTGVKKKPRFPVFKGWRSDNT